jgi:hypothetical protein
MAEMQFLKKISADSINTVKWEPIPTEGPMSEPNLDWKLVDEVAGSIQGELIKSLLNAQGIDVVLSEEGAGRVLGLNTGPMGNVQVFVPEASYAQAKGILELYYSGDMEITDQEDGLADEGNP